MIPQGTVPPASKELPRYADVEEETTKVAMTPREDSCETTGAAVRFTTFNFVHYIHEDLLRRVNLNSDPKISLRDINHAYAFSLLKLFHAYRFDHAKRRLSDTNASTTTHLEEFESALSKTPRVLDGAASKVLLDGRDLLQAL